MKLIIAGSRNFNNYEFLSEQIDLFIKEKYPNELIEIVSGTARGADNLSERYAAERKYRVYLFPAEWDRYGKSAGYKRNYEMGTFADVAVCFWDGESKGTRSMLDIMKKLGKPAYAVYY